MVKEGVGVVVVEGSVGGFLEEDGKGFYGIGDILIVVSLYFSMRFWEILRAVALENDEGAVVE